MHQPAIWALLTLLSLLIPPLANASTLRDEKDGDEPDNEVFDPWNYGDDEQLFREYSPPPSPTSRPRAVGTEQTSYDTEAFRLVLVPLHQRVFEYVLKGNWELAAEHLGELETQLALFEKAADRGVEDDSTIALYVGHVEELSEIRSMVMDWKETLSNMGLYLPEKKKSPRSRSSSHPSSHTNFDSLEGYYPSSTGGLGLSYQIPGVLQTNYARSARGDNKGYGLGEDLKWNGPKGRDSQSSFPPRSSWNEGRGRGRGSSGRKGFQESRRVRQAREELALEEARHFILTPPERFYGGEHVEPIFREVYRLMGVLDDAFLIKNMKLSCERLVTTMNTITTQLDHLNEKTIPGPSDTLISYYGTFLKPVSVYLNRFLAGYFGAAAESIYMYCGANIEAK